MVDTTKEYSTTAIWMRDMAESLLPQGSPDPLINKVARDQRKLRNGVGEVLAGVLTDYSLADRTLVAAQKSNPKSAERYLQDSIGLQDSIKMNDTMLRSFEKQYGEIVAKQISEMKKPKSPKEAEKLVADLSKEAEELLKKVKGFSKSEAELQEKLKDFLKRITTEIPASRSEQASQLIEGKKPSEEESPRNVGG